MNRILKQTLITVAVLAFSSGVYVIVRAQINKNNLYRAEQEDKMPSIDPDDIEGTRTNENPLKELKKITAAYNHEKKFSFKSVIQAFRDDASKPAEQTTMLYEKDGDNQYYSIADQEYVYKDSSVLFVNHQIKVMSYATGAMPVHQNQSAQLKHIEEYMKQDGAEAIVSQTEKEKIITINNAKHPNVQQYVIRYSPETYYVSEIRIYMAIVQEIGADEPAGEDGELKKENIQPEKADGDTSVSLQDFGMEQAVYRVVIRYSDYTTLFTPDMKHQINYFIKEANGELEPTELYKDYELNY